MDRLLSYRQIKALALCTPFLVHSGSANLLERQNVAPPSTLPDKWSYQGCYTYVVARYHVEQTIDIDLVPGTR